MTSADIGRIVNLEQPALSPDGSRVALVLTRASMAHATYENELITVSVADGRILSLVRGRDVSTPRWAPGGALDYIATGADGVSQLFERGAGGAEHAVTHAAGDVIDYARRPGGAEYAYAAYDPPPNAAALRAHHDWFEAGDNAYTASGPPASVHLWLASADGKRVRRLTSGSWTLPPVDRGGIFTSQFAWKSDGRSLFFTRVENAFDGDNEQSTLRRLDLADGRIERVTSRRRYELSPLPAPRGDALAYWYPRDGDFISENELHVIAGGRDRDLTRSLDRNTGGSMWLPAGDAFLVCADDGVRSRLWQVSLRGAIVPVDLGGLDVVCDSYSSSTFDAGIALSAGRDGALAFVAPAPERARELYYLGPGSHVPRRLTRLNAFIETLALGATREIAWNGALGIERGVLTFPPKMVRGRRYPVALVVHGGPGLASLVDFAWESWPLAQLLAARGYIVFQPNYRGSDADGNAYMRAIYRDSVVGPSADILAGLSAVSRLPEVDPSRIAVSGWSYGGLLTSWLIERRHSWCAAVSGAAVNDEVEEYDLSVTNVQSRYSFGLSPWKPGGRAVYRTQSPSEFYDRITTPTLIWATSGDVVVPVTMAYSMYHALKDRGVPVKLVVFPGKSHGPSNPVQTADLTDLWGAFFDEHCKR